MYNKYIILIAIICIILSIFKRWNIIIILLVLIGSTYIIINKIKKTTNKHDRSIENKYCRKSDINNPMGNVLLYTDKDELEYNMCKNQNIDSNLRFNIYNDKKDLYLRKNNIRPFITMPSILHPNDLDNVKNTIYYFNDTSCKLNGTNCAFNENIKYHKNYFLDNKIKTNT